MNSINDIIALIARRDDISLLEAENLVHECMEELMSAVMRGDYQEAEDIVASYLTLEPDYLDIMLNEMFY